MIPAHIVKIQTPKKLLLNGIWLGPARSETVLIWIHGLGGNAFAHAALAERMISKKVSVLSFNNRGSAVINRVKQLNRKSPKGYDSHTMGMAHEVFTDCVDDIEGAVRYASETGAKKVILIGHSTGCQKSVYYLANRPDSLVKGAILLAPMSDYADMVKTTAPKHYAKLVATARKMVAEGKSHALLSPNLWPAPIDAQRFLSLFISDSIEEIFSYATDRRPALLQRVKRPLLVVLAELDEYRERPMEEIARWFKKVTAKQEVDVKIIPNAIHNFFETEDDLLGVVKPWLKKLS